MRKAALIVALFLASCGTTEETTCEQMCRELVQTCEYEAFPTTESCLQGCEFNADEGNDVEEQLDCVLDAECDTFEIVECEHDAES